MGKATAFRYKAKKFLADRPYVDFYVPYEGEIPILNLAKAANKYGKSAEAIKGQSTNCLDGVFFISQGELIGKNRNRVKNKA